MPHEHGRMQYWRELTQGLRRLKPRVSDWAQPAPPVDFIDPTYLRMAQEAAARNAQRRLRKATPKYQAMLRARQVEKEKHAAARKLRQQLLKADTAEGKLYVLMRRDIHEQNERKFREHVRAVGRDDGNHYFTVWHHAGRPEVWLDGRATCTAGDMVEEFERMLYGDNEVPLFIGVRMT